MFSKATYKYLKAAASKYQNTTLLPASIDSELIMYAHAIVGGLNLNSRNKFYIEQVSTSREGDITATIRQERCGRNQTIKIKLTSIGEFLFKMKSEYFVNVEEVLSRNLLEKYFVYQTEKTRNEEQHSITFRMPLRQLKSRNLLAYSFFILDLAKPFWEAANAQVAQAA